MRVRMVQGQVGSIIVEYPDTGAVIADMKRNTDFLWRTIPNMHNNTLCAPLIIFWIFADNLALKCLPAQGRQSRHEFCVRILFCWLAAGGYQSQNDKACE